MDRGRVLHQGAGPVPEGSAPMGGRLAQPSHRGSDLSRFISGTRAFIVMGSDASRCENHRELLVDTRLLWGEEPVPSSIRMLVARRREHATVQRCLLSVSKQDSRRMAPQQSYRYAGADSALQSLKGYTAVRVIPAQRPAQPHVTHSQMDMSTRAHTCHGLAARVPDLGRGPALPQQGAPGLLLLTAPSTPRQNRGAL